MDEIPDAKNPSSFWGESSGIWKAGVLSYKESNGPFVVSNPKWWSPAQKGKHSCWQVNVHPRGPKELILTPLLSPRSTAQQQIHFLLCLHKT